MRSKIIFLPALLLVGSVFTHHVLATPKAAEDKNAQVTTGAPVKPPKAGAKTGKKPAPKPKTANVNKTPHNNKSQKKNMKQ